MENILIIKTAAIGDVVRTTSLLRALPGNIYWVTSAEGCLLLPGHVKTFLVEEAFASLRNIPFSQVISLEEDYDCARLATSLNNQALSGIYLHNGRIVYTDDSAHWFDMSRVSKFGIEKANELKAANTRSCQDHIFQIAGRKFQGEPYQIHTDIDMTGDTGITGIEKRSGKQWPNKQWWGYDELIARLEKEGRAVKIFEQRKDIRDYLRDISTCSHIVSGDTLAMHLALALGKTCTAIFNCTSPQEIYGYGLLKKVVSPLLNEYFYATTFNRELIESIPVEEVYKQVSEL